MIGVSRITAWRNLIAVSKPAPINTFALAISSDGAQFARGNQGAEDVLAGLAAQLLDVGALRQPYSGKPTEYPVIHARNH